MGEIMQNHVVLWYCGGSQEAAVAGGAELQHLQEEWKKEFLKNKIVAFAFLVALPGHILELFSWKISCLGGGIMVTIGI